MNNESIINQLKEAIQRRGERPAREQIEEMVNDRVIDRKGNVLLRRPESSPWSIETRSETSNGVPPLAESPSEIEEAGLNGGMEISVQDASLVIKSVVKPRAGWASAFESMAKHGDDSPIDQESPTPNSWDESEWEW